MTDKDKILKALCEERNQYARDRERYIAEEQGKIIGADYMLQRMLAILSGDCVDNHMSEKENE